MGVFQFPVVIIPAEATQRQPKASSQEACKNIG